MKLLAATENKHKLEEIRQILAGLDIEVIAPSDVGVTLDIEETGSTFMENAEIKARAAHALTGLPSVADDSGLCVDALGGKPGVHSHRYGGEDTPHSEKIKILLGELADVPDDKRTARFVSAIFCVLDDGQTLSCEGTCEGMIGYEPKGDNGFGYDPVFMTGVRSFAQLSDSEKNAISHRGNALRKFAEILKDMRGLVIC